MTIYIVENYDTCEFEAFEGLEQAATYVRKYYKDHMVGWLSNSSDSAERIIQTVKEDLENLEAEYPFIQDTMYTYKVRLHINEI